MECDFCERTVFTECPFESELLKRTEEGCISDNRNWINKKSKFRIEKQKMQTLSFIKST